MPCRAAGRTTRHDLGTGLADRNDDGVARQETYDNPHASHHHRMNTQGIDQLLRELSQTAAKAGGQEPAEAAGAANFADLLKSSLDQVNAAQQQATSMQQAFDANDPNVNLQEVMVSLQKANLSFQTMVQVRNRLVTAYQEIMNMQV
jgi:flagellar hook-basal body complex protein FliE